MSGELTVVFGEEAVVEESTTDETDTAATDEAVTGETTAEEATGEEATGDTNSGDEAVVPGESAEAGVEGETAGNEKFSDVATDHWAVQAVEKMTTAGIVNGNPDGSFAPNEQLNRASAAVFFDRVYSALKGGAVEVGTNAFSDVKSSEWYAETILRLYKLQVVKGNPDGTFNPSGSINRAEFITMAVRLYKLIGSEAQLQELESTADSSENSFEDVKADEWFYADVKSAANLGFVEGRNCGEANHCYFPQDKITRAEAVVILNRMFGAGL